MLQTLGVLWFFGYLLFIIGWVVVAVTRLFYKFWKSPTLTEGIGIGLAVVWTLLLFFADPHKQPNGANNTIGWDWDMVDNKIVLANPTDKELYGKWTVSYLNETRTKNDIGYKIKLIKETQTVFSLEQPKDTMSYGPNGQNIMLYTDSGQSLARRTGTSTGEKLHMLIFHVLIYSFAAIAFASAQIKAISCKI